MNFNKRKMIEESVAKQWNVRDDLKSLSLSSIVEEQKKNSLPFALCALNLTGDLNVGILIRNAVVFGAERVFIFGRKKYDKRSTVGAQNYIDVVRVSGMKDELTIDINSFYDTMYKYNYTPVMVELGGMNIDEYKLRQNSKSCFIFGNEGNGIPEELLFGNDIVSIPQRGVLRSLNVGTASGIICHSVVNKLS